MNTTTSNLPNIIQELQLDSQQYYQLLAEIEKIQRLAKKVPELKVTAW